MTLRSLLRGRRDSAGQRTSRRLAETPVLRGLAFDFVVRSDDSSLVEYVEHIYGACVATGAPRTRGAHLHRFTLLTGNDVAAGLGSRDSALCSLTLDDEVCVEGLQPGSAVAHLVWEVNRAVVGHSGDRLLLHAAAAESDGAVVLLPAPRESGKSTLVAGLVVAGLRYLTDEVTAVDLASAEVGGFAKPIGLDPGSWEVLRELGPLTAGAPDPLPATQWLVPPLAVRPDAVGIGGRVSLVVFPCYRPGLPTELRPIPRAEALVALVESSFNFHALGAPALHAAAALPRDAACFRLDVSDLGTACDVIIDELARTRSAVRS